MIIKLKYGLICFVDDPNQSLKDSIAECIEIYKEKFGPVNKGSLNVALMPTDPLSIYITELSGKFKSGQ